ncbi:MAG: 2-phospho-L-lactate guanylyltransferase [Pseudomonadota bacterium]
MMRTLITVPMKEPTASKTRLAGELNAKARVRLVRLLYKRTLEFLLPIAEQVGADLSVVTGSEEAAKLARHFGYEVIGEPAGDNLTAATKEAAKWAIANGYNRLCIVPADLAAPSANDLVKFLESDAAVAICPSEDKGTNALLVSPPDAIPFRYGPMSAIRHHEEAEARGLDVKILPLESLSFDIDTGTCLERAIFSQPDIAEACA